MTRTTGVITLACIALVLATAAGVAMSSPGHKGTDAPPGPGPVEAGHAVTSLPAAVVSTVPPAAPEHAVRQPPAAAAPGARAAALDTPAGAAAADATAPTPEAGAFTIEVSPQCATPGQRVVAVVRAVRDAHVSLVVAYADGSNHGEMFAGPVRDDGVLEFGWTVPAAAPKGRGHVYMAGHDPATSRSTSGEAAFDVAGGCR